MESLQRYPSMVQLGEAIKRLGYATILALAFVLSKGSFAQNKETISSLDSICQFPKQEQWLIDRYSHPIIKARLLDGEAENIVDRIQHAKIRTFVSQEEYNMSPLTSGGVYASDFNTRDSVISLVAGDSLGAIHERTHQAIALPEDAQILISQYIDSKKIARNRIVFNSRVMINEVEADSIETKKIIQDVAMAYFADQGLVISLNAYDEIYAYIVELRYMYGLQPGQEVTLEMVKHIRRSYAQEFTPDGTYNYNEDTRFALLYIIFSRLGIDAETNEIISQPDFELLRLLLNTLP